MADTFCDYCGSEGGHLDGCPEISDDPELIKEWEHGYWYEWEGSLLEPYEYPHHSKTFLLGYWAGKGEINLSVDEPEPIQLS